MAEPHFGGLTLINAEKKEEEENEGLLELDRVFQHESSRCIYRGKGVEKGDVYALE